MEDTELKFINPYKLFHGAFIPNWLLRRTEISASAKLCYARLCQYAGRRGVCFPSQESLADEIGTNSRQIRRLLDELIKYNLITTERMGKKKNNLYKFLYHLWMDENITNTISEENTIIITSKSDEISQSDRTICPITQPRVIGQPCPITHQSDRTQVSYPYKDNIIIKNKRIIKTSSSQVKRTCDPVAINLSKFLLTEILKNNPSSRLHSLSVAAQETTITRWARDMDLLIRKDRQEPSTVEEVIRYCTADGFWGANILSGKKLREKWDTLAAQMKRPKNQRKEVSQDARLAHLQKVFGGDTKAGNGV